MPNSKDERAPMRSGGGAIITGSVQVGGDFIGRDKVTLPGCLQPETIAEFTGVLDEIRTALDRSELDPEVLLGLKTDVDAAKTMAARDEPLMDVARAKLKSVQQVVASLGSAAKSVDPILSLITKAAKLVGMVL